MGSPEHPGSGCAGCGGLPERLGPGAHGGTNAPTGPYTITLEKFTPGAPIIHRLTIDDVTYNSARFYVTIDPNGLPTTYEIEWGQDISYGNVFVPASNGMEGIGARTVLTEKLRNIPAFPELDFRVVATNALGRTESEGQSIPLPVEPTLWSIQETPAQSMVRSHRAHWCCRER